MNAKPKSVASPRTRRGLRSHCLTLSVAVALGLSFGAPVWASGVPVVDVAAIAEAIKQYQQMVQQLETLNNQLNQAKQQYESMTGGRGMENLLANENRNAIPTNWQETLAMMEGGGQISGLAQSIKESSRRVDTATLDQLSSSARTMYEQQSNSSASQLASAGTVYDSASERFGRLQGLMDAIPTATDLKAVGDLQARIQVEQVMLQNESIKMQALAQAAAAQNRIERQQAAELMMVKPTGRQQLAPVVSRSQ